MSKKQQQIRLDNLFSALDEMEHTLPEVKTGQVDNWSWECNQIGIYTACSVEVEDHLGFLPTEFLGKSVYQFAIHPQSGNELHKAIQQNLFPIELEITFQTSTGSWLAARTNVFLIPGDNGNPGGYRGFCQVLPKPVSFPQTRPLATKPSRERVSPKKKVVADKSETTVSGWAVESGTIKESSEVWTPEAKTSITTQQPVFITSQPDSPATMAIPFQFGGNQSGILEIQDEKEQRKWSEDERQLAQDVASQLALALENAELYAKVQEELTERVHAEQEILQRNQYLATINRIGQELSRLVTRDEIFSLFENEMVESLNLRNITLALYDLEKHIMSFPVNIINNKHTPLPDRPLSNSIPDYIIQQKTSLLIPNQVRKELIERKIDPPLQVPASLLGVPMLTGERCMGAIIFQDFENPGSFSSIQLELVSTIASQVTTSLENAGLFQEIRDALAVIETRERYQANVAKAIALLTESGIKAILEVLEILNHASRCSRIYCTMTIETEAGKIWKPFGVWIESKSSRTLNNRLPQEILAAEYPFWTSELQEKGWVCGKTSDFPSPEKDFLKEQHIRSLLLISIPGKNPTPGFIAFEQADQDRQWLQDEINVLQVAADAISNTMTREDLLGRLQATLEETESLYKTSNRLAIANDIQEMVSALASGLHSPDINQGVLVLFDYDLTGKLTNMKVAANWSSGQGSLPPPVGMEYPKTPFERLLVSSTPVFYDDIEEAQFEDDLKSIFTKQKINSIAILPLWASKKQLGTLLLNSENKHQFSGREIRTCPPLVSQMAIAIDNLRLFEQTQASLKETELLYKLSNEISQASNVQDLITLVARNIIPKNAERVSILQITQEDSEEQPLEFEAVGYYDVYGGYQRVGVRLPTSAMPLLKNIGTEAVFFPDVNKSNLDSASKKTLQQSNIISVCVVPLRSAGRLIGLMTVSARRPSEFEPEEIRLLQIAGFGITVALERQRLLRETERRALELQTAAEVARDTTKTLSPDLLLSQIVNLLCERFDFYHASVFLLDEHETYAIVRESTGEAGKELKSRSHKLAVGSKSIIGTVTMTGTPLLVNDVSQSSIFFPNPLLPDTRSEMGIPLKLGDRIIGALDIQSNQVNAFTPNEVSVLQILADQIAIAIENARAYELSQKAVEEIKEVDRVKSQFLANMSHELRTPLNSIIGFSRVILKGIDGPINETQKQDLNAIYNSGQHLLALINNILDISKIEAGKMELAFTEVYLGDIINSVVSTAIGLVKDKSISLKQNVPPDLPPVYADSTRVRQILLNLVSNAAKFTEQGFVSVDVTLSSSPEGKQEVMISVTDTGEGIAAEDLNKLFLPFSQVDNSPTRKTGGTGLGLSICRSLIELHGGRIGLAWSEIGKGSCFYFTLPLAEKQPEETSTTKALTAKPILAIDDDPQVISLYQRYLEPQGYQIVPLTDPKMAVSVAKEIKPFAITLDIMMPEKDGWEVMHDLKHDPDTREIPIIICSILEEEEKGVSLGAADYLVKPFLQEELINAINRLNRGGEIHEILVIDDDPKDLRLVQKIIEGSQKYQAVLAQGGKEGWNKIQQKRPDAIILDLFMPDLDGFTLLEKIRSDRSLMNLPIIILTGVDLTAEQHSQMSQFGQQLLSKSFLREKELLISLENALKKIQRGP